MLKTASQLSMFVWEMQLRLVLPAGYYGSCKSDQENSVKQHELSFGIIALSEIKTFKEYVKYLIEERKLTGSCGQTSSWLHRITGGLLGSDGGQETPLTIENFLSVLDNHKSKPFYMRVLTGGHSFVIESSGSSMAIYQSWHGSAPMAFMLESGLVKISPGLMISMLRDVLTPKKSLMSSEPDRESTSKKLFYGQDHKDPTPLVWFNINLNPL